QHIAARQPGSFHWLTLPACSGPDTVQQGSSFIPTAHAESIVDSPFRLQLDLTTDLVASPGTEQDQIREIEMTGRRLALALAAALLATPALVATQCSAQDYPTRPIKIIVPFGAGGPADVTARLIGNVLQENFGQPFVVENRTGAGGVIGTLEAARSPPDGYTLLMMSNTQTANESLAPERKYELMRDLAPIAPVNYSDLVIVVHPSVQAKTLQEFIALAKSQPGKLNYASSGQGTPYHMAG